MNCSMRDGVEWISQFRLWWSIAIADHPAGGRDIHAAELSGRVEQLPFGRRLFFRTGWRDTLPVGWRDSWPGAILIAIRRADGGNATGDDPRGDPVFILQRQLVSGLTLGAVGELAFSFFSRRALPAVLSP